MLKKGDRVRMTAALKAGMQGQCLPGKHVEPTEVGTTDDGCMKCSTDHIEEFGECEGIVEGPMYPGWPEVDVRWQPSNSRFGYKPEHLELVDTRT
jgi:hypothetical protein